MARQGALDRVAAYLLARADRDLAADVLSRTFEVAWRRIADVPREPFPWLLGVARKVLADLRRGQGRQDVLMSRIAATILETSPDPRSGSGVPRGLVKRIPPGAELTARERLKVQVEPKPWPATAGAGTDFEDGCQRPATG